MLLEVNVDKGEIGCLGPFIRLLAYEQLMDGKWHEYNYLRDQLVCIDSKAPKDGEGRERRHYEVIREQTKALLRDLHVTLRVLRVSATLNQGSTSFTTLYTSERSV